MVKISGDFLSVTPQICDRYEKMNAIYKDSSTTKKELGENKEIKEAVQLIGNNPFAEP